MRTIKFKSTPDNFRKEYLGLKCNTLRKDHSGNIPTLDIRFEILDDFINEKWNLLAIEIACLMLLGLLFF